MSWVLPCLGSSWLLNRLLHVTAALLVPYLLLSLGREAFFLPLLALYLYSWTRLELTTEQKQVTGGPSPGQSRGVAEELVR